MYVPSEESTMRGARRRATTQLVRFGPDAPTRTRHPSPQLRWLPEQRGGDHGAMDGGLGWGGGWMRWTGMSGVSAPSRATRQASHVQG